MPISTLLLRIRDALHIRWRKVYTRLILRRFYGYLGDGVVIYPQRMVRFPHLIRIGDRSMIREGGRIEVILHGQEWQPALTIGENVNIEQDVHIVCHDRIHIGNNVSITGHCAIVDVSHPLDAIEQGHKIGDVIDTCRSFVEIGDHCFIGYGTSILPNVRIGRNSVIGAGSVVTRDIPENSIASGTPAKVVRTRSPL